MLAAYLRMKYPHVVAGAIAASAPIHMYPGMMPCQVFNRILTSSFHHASHKCDQNIKKSWSEIRNFSATANGSDWLQKNWRLCDPVKNATQVDLLIEFLASMYTTLAMVNYPFPSDFLVPLPANPVRVVCQYLDTDLKGQKLLEAYSADCHKKYGVYPRENDARLTYGGSLLQAASNIVFSNGLIDPWAAGGVVNGLSESVQALVIPGAAHHLDLMPASAADPQPVLEARQQHKNNINHWINQYNAKNQAQRRWRH
ncbi:putative Lysosomal Pro-X carboxypeptidase, partial [Operophtera brumata]